MADLGVHGEQGDAGQECAEGGVGRVWELQMMSTSYAKTLMVHWYYLKMEATKACQAERVIAHMNICILRSLCIWPCPGDYVGHAQQSTTPKGTLTKALAQRVLSYQS